jgi:hypothetical protein
MTCDYPTGAEVRIYDPTLPPFSSRRYSTLHETDVPSGILASVADGEPVETSKFCVCPGSTSPVDVSVLPRRSEPIFQTTLALYECITVSRL